MGATREQRLLKQVGKYQPKSKGQKFEPKTPIATGMFAPNKSGRFDFPVTFTQNVTVQTINTSDPTNWDTAYTHSQDNSQAHSDYMLNTGDSCTGDYTFTGDITVDNERSGIIFTYSGDVSKLNADFLSVQLPFYLSDGVGRQLILADYDTSINHNFDHAVQTNPTLYVHSATDPNTANDEWISLTHNQTDGIIDVGSGKVLIGATGDDDLVCNWLTVNTITLSAQAGDMSMNNHKVTDVLTPTADSDAATKKYVDDNHPALGAWASKTIGTTYQAGTDGFVVFGRYNCVNNLNAKYEGRTDGNNPPTTVRAAASMSSWSGLDMIGSGSGTMPVKKGDYYRVVRTYLNGSSGTQFMYWIPLG